MAYTAFETAAGEALAEVASLCRHAARASGAFSSSTVPTLVAVERYLTTSHYWIHGLLRRAGLDVEQTDPAVLGILQQLNVYDACIKIELSLPANAETGDGNSRFQTFEERRTDLVEMITDGSLAAMPDAVLLSTSMRTPIITGISNSRKRLTEENRDATQHRVRRGQFGHHGLLNPTSDTDVDLLQ